MKLKPTATLPGSTPHASELLGHALDSWAGATLKRGLLRIHNATTGPQATEELLTAFGDEAEGLTAFATDWKARHYAVGLTPDGPYVIRADISTIELDAITTLEDFIGLITTDRKAAAFFDINAFDEFRVNHRVLALDFEQSASYKIPPFLGGPATPENMDLALTQVHWALFGQLYQQVKDLPPGTPVTDIHLG